MTFQQIKAETLRLPEHSRAQLALCLLLSSPIPRTILSTTRSGPQRRRAGIAT